MPEESRKLPSSHSLLLLCIIGIIISLPNAYDFTLRVMPAATMTMTMTFFNTTPGIISLFSSFYFLGYCVMQIPSGLFFDYFNTKTLLFLSTFFCALATLFFSLTHYIIVACLMRLIIGMFSAFSYIGALKISTQWYPNKFIPTVAGLVQMIGCIGAIAGLGPTAWLSSLFSLKKIYIITALIGIILSLMILCIPNKKNLNTTRHKKASNKLNLTHQLVTILAAIKGNKKLPGIFIYGFFIWAPVSVFGSTWGPTFFHIVYRLPTIQSANLVSWLWIGIGVGGPVLGILSSFFNTRKKIIACCSAAGILASLTILFSISLPLIAIKLALCTIGICSSSQVICFGLIIDYFSEKMMGVLAGAANLSFVLGGTFLPSITGYCIELFSKHDLTAAIHLINPLTFSLSLTLIPICYTLALITALLFIQETHCKPQYETIRKIQ